MEASSSTPLAQEAAQQGAAVLRAARLLRTLGSGSNGVVVAARFVRQPSAPAPAPSAPAPAPPAPAPLPLHRTLALKVMSHFWDAQARKLLDCERRTLQALPPHRGVVRLFRDFEARLDDAACGALLPFLTPDMQQAAAAAAAATSAANASAAASAAAAKAAAAAAAAPPPQQPHHQRPRPHEAASPPQPAAALAAVKRRASSACTSSRRSSSSCFASPSTARRCTAR